MTASFVHAGTIAVANSAQTTLVIPYPSPTTPGNLILLTVSYTVGAGTPPNFTVPPTGFTTIGSGGSNGVFKYIFRLITGATGSEGGTSLTLNNTSGLGGGGSAWAGQFTEWAGCDGTTSACIEGFNTTEGASTTVAGHSITTLGPNRLGIHFVASFMGTPFTGIGVPASWTGVFDEPNATSGSSGGSTLHLDTIVQAGAGTITAPSSTSTSGQTYASFDFALVPGTAPTSVALLGQAWL